MALVCPVHEGGLLSAFSKCMQHLMAYRPSAVLMPPSVGMDELALAVEEEFGMSPSSITRQNWNRDDGEQRLGPS